MTRTEARPVLPAPTTTGASMGAPVFDPLAPEWVQDPYPHYAALRERDPIHRLDGLDLWVVTRYEECRTLLHDRRLSSDSRSLDLDRPGPFGGALLELRPFLFQDPPDHTRLRRLVSKAFAPPMVDGLRAKAEGIVVDLLDDALESGVIDIVEEFAYPLPVRIICELLGLPLADRALLQSWSADLARSLDPDYLLTEETIGTCRETAAAFTDYLSELITERRARPGDDLLSRLVEVEDGGETLSEDEVVSTVMLLMVAGHETTAHLVAGGTHVLLQRPETMARLRNDPGALPTAVEELARFVSPVQLTGRVVTEPVELGGTTLNRGEFVLLLLAAANRDPAQFPDPDRLDLTRTPNPHLAFGFGVHHCLGTHLARMETEVALAGLLARSAGLELASDAVTYASSLVVRGPVALPVRFRT